MIRKEQETQNIEVIKDILCNKCGKSCKKHEGFEESFSFADLNVHWGYFSDDNRDGEVHEAHLCQSCWEGIVATFKHSDLVSENQY
jgi:hypothetical protein